ncbi:MAG TPA: PAS domain S-box protein [Burkholderiales bacterium]|nr:PAS domain S-box protein [Burkholderiales bacterium]
MDDIAISHPSFEAAGDYRLVFETIPHMVWATNAGGELEFCNRSCCDYLGRSLQEISGEGWQDVIHPTDLAACLEKWRRSLRSGARFDVEYRLRRHDGEYRWHHGRALPLRGARGTILRWFGTCTDIDDQVRAGQRLEEAVGERTAALLESESRFRSLLALSSDWYWEQDAQFRFTAITHASAAARALVPLRLGLKRWELGFINMTEADWAAHRRTLEAHLPFRDLVLCQRDEHGAKSWVSTSGEPIFAADGAFAGYRGIGRDITLQRRAEEALRESERRFQLFMDHSPAVAWIKDGALRYTYVSEPFLQKLKKTREELIGRSDLECWPEAAAEAVRRSWHNDQVVQREGRTLQATESAPVAPQGEIHHWLSTRFPLADGSGAVGVAGTAIDITERVEAESAARQHAEEVRALLDRLMAAQESERKRVSSELHDLIGQNLTALGIWLANIANALGGGGDEKTLAQVASMQRTVEKTIEAIRGVMGELRPPELDEYGLLPALRAYAAEFQARTSIRTSVECAGALRRLPGVVEVSLFRIVQEALTNAAKHSGGTAIRVRIERQPDRLRLCVEDDGRGFPEPLGARKSRRGGWGLPTIRERAEACGGFLRIEHPGRGTRLVVEVPASDAHAH